MTPPNRSPYQQRAIASEKRFVFTRHGGWGSEVLGCSRGSIRQGNFPLFSWRGPRRWFNMFFSLPCSVKASCGFSNPLPPLRSSDSWGRDHMLVRFEHTAALFFEGCVSLCFLPPTHPFVSHEYLRTPLSVPTVLVNFLCFSNQNF